MCEIEKVQCLHCDGLTLTSRDSSVDCSKNCGCILPSTKQRAMISGFCLGPVTFDNSVTRVFKSKTPRS